ncbi:DBP6 [[Candida] subhashii]|uniref:ATP-dependent RNA helicase n=1 Tax=[Candida] subhashii TaxID=561895 RepID=A0A8J5QS65_9ASCO|nr:DBP6 [[Candida] subhashii]KAG7664312.1 DBP6 [[Candida] subhashii]
MFGARFDPTALDDNVIESNTPTKSSILNFRKRRLSTHEDDKSDDEEREDTNDKIEEDDNSSEDESSEDSDDGESESDNESEEDEEEKEADDDDTMSIDEKEGDEQIEKDAQIDPDYISKHKAIFDKFKKSVVIETTTQVSSDEQDEEEEQVQTQDLAPLPQPQLPRDKKLVSTTTHLKNLDWLATAIYSSPTDTKRFSDITQLSPFMQKNLLNNGFTHAFSVQIAVLDLMLQDIQNQKLQPDIMGDILVNASTGSGKTLAYSIPIIEALHTRIVPRVRAIVLVPTKPLINQVRSTMLSLSKGTNLNIVSLKNDVSIKEEAGRLSNNSPPDIIVSTPGRLVEHILAESIDLDALRFLVIDEADRLLNQSFQNWCSVLMSKIDHHINIAETWGLSVQKLIFSATLTTDAGKLSSLKFRKPRLVIVNDQHELVNEMFNVPPTLLEYKLHFGVSKSSIKPLILSRFLISQEKLANVLIFTKSNESSLRLSKLLQLLLNQLLPTQEINITYINSTNNRTSIRQKILKDFSTQKINILVATDLIARGIDILSISDIINYDLPNSAREYVHRVGRTARANQAGNAYNFVFGKGENKWFNTISREVGRRDKKVEKVEFEVKELVSGEDEVVYQDVLQELQKQLAKH